MMQKKLGTSLKAQEVQKKSVFKPLLTNPYTRKSTWPKIDFQLQTDLLQALETTILPPVKQYNQLTQEEKKMFSDSNSYDLDVLIGFNSIMKALEAQVQSKLKNKDTISEKDDTDITMLFVCKSDVSCRLLCMHLPTLCALAKVKLIALPKGSSKRLSSALGRKNELQFLALRRRFIGKNAFVSSMVNSSVDDVTVGFLDNIERQQLNMNVKFVLTEMPIVSRTKKSDKQQDKSIKQQK